MVCVASPPLRSSVMTTTVFCAILASFPEDRLGTLDKRISAVNSTPKPQKQVTVPTARPLQHAQHPGVAQSVRLDAFQIEELRDTFVGRPQQFRGHLRLDRRVRQRVESVPLEECGFEG